MTHLLMVLQAYQSQFTVLLLLLCKVLLQSYASYIYTKREGNYNPMGGGPGLPGNAIEEATVAANGDCGLWGLRG